jgi:hypothetical protein
MLKEDHQEKLTGSEETPSNSTDTDDFTYF